MLSAGCTQLDGVCCCCCCCCCHDTLPQTCASWFRRCFSASR
jgi:hypothetical protein